MSSLMSSVIQTYSALTAANFPGASRPPAYHTQAPTISAAGTQVYPPYVVFTLASLDETLTFEDDGFEASTLTAVAYADTQGDADTIISCVRFNGQAVSARAGFDGAAALTNFTDFGSGGLLSVLPYRPPVPGYAGVGKSGQRVHTATMVWKVEVNRA